MAKKETRGEMVTRPETTENFVRIPVAKKEAGDKIRTITISAKEGIKALYATNRRVILTYLFAKAKKWTMAKAKAWVKSHNKSEKSIILKSMKNISRFQFEIPKIQPKIRLTKSKDGSEVEEKFIEGVASSTDVDLHGDKMAPEAIDSMANSLKKHVVALNAEHDRSWQSELGEVSKFDINDKYDLVMEAKLDNTSKANDLWIALTEKKKQLGLSIGGYVKDFKIEVDEEGDWHRTFTNIELDHVAVTSTPANPHTWVSNIAKSVNDVEALFKGNVVRTEIVEEKDEEAQLTNNKPEMAKNTPLETDVVKEEEVETEAKAEETTTPEVDKTVTPENGTAEGDVEEDETEGDEEVVEDEKVEETEETDENSVEETAKKTETTEKSEEEVVPEEGGTEAEENKIEEKKDDSTDETDEIRLEKVEKSLEQISKLFDSEGITKTLSTLTEKVEEVLKSNEELVNHNTELIERVDALENQPAGRKLASVDKDLGSSNSTTTPEKSLTEALKEADAKYKNNQNLFSIKQRIRNTYADMGITE